MSLTNLVARLAMIAAFMFCVSAHAVFAQSKYVPVTKYDPQRNADQDVRDATVEARRTNRRILLEVGGEWCSWCHRLDEFFEAHQDLITARDKNFVTVKINFSEENPNRAVLGRYAEIPGYPHIFVLDSNGTLLRSQGTGDFEEGKSYNAERLMTFLNVWATAPKDTALSQ